MPGEVSKLLRAWESRIARSPHYIIILAGRLSRGAPVPWMGPASRKGNVSSSAFRSLLCRWLDAGALHSTATTDIHHNQPSSATPLSTSVSTGDPRTPHDLRNQSISPRSYHPDNPHNPPEQRPVIVQPQQHETARPPTPWPNASCSRSSPS